jgi:hypothetical protein
MSTSGGQRRPRIDGKRASGRPWRSIGEILSGRKEYVLQEGGDLKKL